MTTERVVEAARRYGPILDNACTTACESIWRAGGYSDFELREGYKELWRLSEGQDLAYDRPSIGLHYALWYHLQRTHLLIRGLLPLLVDSQSPLTIYDVGSGTGATAWAAAVIVQSCKEANVDVPGVRVYGCDTSPFMLETSDRLWSALPSELTSRFTPENLLGSWSEYQRDSENTRKLVVCSFLLNASDQQYLNDIDSSLTRFADRVGAERLLMLLSANKAHLGAALRRNRNWQRQSSVRTCPDIWNGRIDRVADLRRSLLQSIGKVSRDPVWTYGRSSLGYYVRTAGELFSHKLTWFELNEEQDRWATPTESTCTALVGPAGSGKSVVLVEQLVRIIESARLEFPRILVTSFNKQMVEQLIRWTRERIKLSSAGLVDGGENGIPGEAHWDMTVKNAYQVVATIWFRNRDKLPTQVWKQPPPGLELLKGPITAVRTADSSPQKMASNWMYRDFLENELELVLYGMEAMDYDKYVDSSRLERSGRPRLGRGGRPLLWPYLVAQSNAITPHNTYLHRRMAAWRHNEETLKKGERIALQRPFENVTHVFVDEVQDMTRADIRLLAHTLPNRRRLFVTGDTTQALHTHGINPRPRIAGANWRVRRLYGTYRLPALLSSALASLASSIRDDQVRRGADEEGAVPHVCRTAVPGPRPIVVSGDHPADLAQAMEMMQCFVPEDYQLAATWHVVHERGSSEALYDSLGGTEAGLYKCSMLAFKGLEMPLVLFPTDVRPPSGKSVPEWVYTALTRAKGVLMIAVRPEGTLQSVAEALGLLDCDQLMFWNQQAKDAWQTMAARSA